MYGARHQPVESSSSHKMYEITQSAFSLHWCPVKMEALPSQEISSVILPTWHGGKESTCQWRRCGFDPRVEKILEEEMAVLTWKVLWTVEPGGLHTVHGITKSRTQPSTHAHNILNPTKWKIHILFLKGSSTNLIKSLPTKSGFSPCCTQEECGMLVNLQRPYNAGEQGHRGAYKDREKKGP